MPQSQLVSPKFADAGALGKDRIYVTNASYTVPSVTVYGKRANGNVEPIRTISGSSTGLVQPMGIAADRAGRIYVSDWFASAGKRDGSSSQQGVVFVFAATANGNVKPIATIVNGLNYPYGVALDNGGNVYVANFEGCDISVYAKSSYKLLRTIESAGSYGLCYSDGIALDGAGNVYVVPTDFSGNPVRHDSSGSGFGFVLVFAAGASGSSLPVQMITGPRTQLTNPYGVAVSSRGEIYVTNYAAHYSTPEILVYAPGANGDVRPIRTIKGAKTQLDGSAIALDARGVIFVANDSDSITEYARRASGDAAPIREISGANTGLDMPSGVAIEPR